MSLLLLHGLGATSSVWGAWPSLVAGRAPAGGSSGSSGRVSAEVVAPDLPGHGGAGRLPSYSVDDVAAALVLPAGPLVVVGHSFGGAVGLALAARVEVACVVAIGVKAVWPESDVERFAALAARPPRVLATREEALARHLAVAGLTDLAVDPEEHADGVVEVEGGWTTALDPRAFAQVSPELAGRVRSAEARGTRVVLLRGEHDAMVSLADLEACATERTVVRDLPGLGHSAHVQDPAAVWSVAADLLM